jgi:hypothetical protein
MRLLDEARIKARTADVSVIGPPATQRGRGGIDYVLDEVDQTLAELSALANVPPDALTTRLRRHRPVLGPSFNPVSVNEPIDPPAPSDTARIVTAIGVFVVGLEYMRTVRGEMAEQYVQNVAYVLHKPAARASQAPE